MFNLLGFLHQLTQRYPRIDDVIDQAIREANIERVSDGEYIGIKNRFLQAQTAWLSGPDIPPSKYQDIQRGIIRSSNDDSTEKSLTDWLASTFSPISKADSNANTHQMWDPEFLTGLHTKTCAFPDAALELRRLLSKWLITTTKDVSNTLAQRVNISRLASYEKSVEAAGLETLAKEINDMFQQVRLQLMGPTARNAAMNGGKRFVRFMFFSNLIIEIVLGFCGRRSMTIASVRYSRPLDGMFACLDIINAAGLTPA